MDTEDEHEPTWDEAVAALETATPVQVVRPNPVPTSDRIFSAMTEAGIFTADEKVRRVVIDLDYKHVPVMYVERYADERILQVIPAIAGIQIRTQREGTMGDKNLPAEERRGGDHPDWANARPGEELPELPGAEVPVAMDADYPDETP